MWSVRKIAREQQRQVELWGEQNHPDLAVRRPESRYRYALDAEFWKQENRYRAITSDLAWDGILLEEVFEALSEEDPEALQEELIQVAAVAATWAESINRREKKVSSCPLCPGDRCVCPTLPFPGK